MTHLSPSILYGKLCPYSPSMSRFVPSYCIVCPKKTFFYLHPFYMGNSVPIYPEYPDSSRLTVSDVPKKRSFVFFVPSYCIDCPKKNVLLSPSILYGKLCHYSPRMPRFVPFYCIGCLKKTFFCFYLLCIP